jgi:ribose 1,5-bisphosphate isomerase
MKKISKQINNLKKDNKSGANEFINKALKIITYQLNLIKDQKRDISSLIFSLSKDLISTRPSMAPLINTIGFLIHDLDTIDKKSLLFKIYQLRERRANISNLLKTHFLSFLSNTRNEDLGIMLISYSSTIINLLNSYEYDNIKVYILESRPLLEGQRVAEILSQKFETNLIVDAAMGKFMDKINLVLIGVDSVLKDGSIINKIGSYPLAVLAKSLNIEVYAICDSFKYNLWSHYGKNVQITRKPIEEIYNKTITSKRFKVYNYYFDITPPEYINGIISELGVLSVNDYIENVRNTIPIDWFKQYLD